ncbi:hypothetical protein [Oricola sp.]|uniref:hypothetical protein n=1 Tax=Oricola sp. TaxID=1979950 RepID=UPI003BA9BC5F
MQPFRLMLAGGKPNSLGRTLEVVAEVLADRARMADLYDCYGSDDELVRLRTSNACRRVFRERPDLFAEYADRLLDEVAEIDQPSAKWTLAQIFLEHDRRLTDAQRARAKAVVVRNLLCEDDWIALNMSMKTLETWTKTDATLKPQIVARVRALADDRRRSVSKGAHKLLAAMGEPVF